MRALMLIIAWVLISFSAICILGIFSNDIPGAIIFKTITQPWIANIEPIISGVLNSLFGLSQEKNIGLWVSVGIPFVIGLILIVLPKPKN